jgi:hypothetical protein
VVACSDISSGWTLTLSCQTKLLETSQPPAHLPQLRHSAVNTQSPTQINRRHLNARTTHLHHLQATQHSLTNEIMAPADKETGLHLPADTESLWKPPPHLEARFSKRRRWQGSSSPHSLLAASNLATTRRQILLEARKSSLRARAQHVERVRRSRASEHDAVADRLLALQASMNAAQKSRDAILAKIARSCASEVAKAKRTAVEMRERREKETKALKETVDERMLEAEKRRQEVLREKGRKRKERGSSTSSTSSMKIDGTDDEVVNTVLKVRAALSASQKEEAARLLQRAWRRSRDRRIVDDFVALGLTIESVRDADFMDISTRFQDEKVLKATSRLLKRCGILEGLEGDAAADLKACRTYLSAYLILGHPAEVLSNDGQNEKVSSKHVRIIHLAVRV